MSRIDEALKQAGIKTHAGAAAAEAPVATLDAFPAAKSSTREPEPESFAPVLARPAPSPKIVNSPFFERLVVHEDAEPAAVEQYRRLAAVLHQAQVERGIKVVMVASAQPGEGKTLTAANLGLTLSESYRRRVLLIDADLRRPSLSALFQLPHSAGLSESLKAREGQEVEYFNITDSLAVLPGGHPDPDPMAGLTSGRMQKVLEQAGTSFDWVVLDTPPVTLLSDTPLLAAMVDAVVMVIDAGSSQYAAVERAIENLGREKVIGVVLNRVDNDALKATQYYDYYYRDNAAKRTTGNLVGRPLQTNR
jgi:capsular exopolysaccharide synthesis family protein